MVERFSYWLRGNPACSAVKSFQNTLADLMAETNG